MKLIKNGTVVDPEWSFFDRESAQEIPAGHIVPFEVFQVQFSQSGNEQNQPAVLIDVDTDIDALAASLDQFALIVIEFAAYADGRGFSIAHRLRHSYGYKGEIWASGSLTSDQYALAVQCGIDAMLIDEKLLQRQPIEHWQEVLANAPVPYRFESDMAKERSDDSTSSKHLIDQHTVGKLNARFKALSTRELLEFVLGDVSMGKISAVSSFGAESAILLHLIAQIAPQTPILFLDTGKLFPETLEYQKQLAARLSLTNVKILWPEAPAIADQDPEGSLWQRDNEACCNLRKVLPLQSALSGYDTWISGRKSYQNDLRAPLQLFEISNGQIKVNPLANWSPEKLADYMQRHNLPIHPLVANGFTSIGCATCTTPTKDGEDARAGRWRGQNKTECGIHFIDGKAVRTQPQPA